MKLFYLFLLCLISCKDTVADNPNLLRVGIASDPTTLDPIFSVDLMSQKINSLLFAKLFRFDANGTISNDLVKDYKLLDTRLIIKLNQLKTIQGYTLTGKDVKYSLERLKSEKGPRKSRYQFIQEIKLISDFEIEIKLDSGNKKYISLLALAPASIYQEDEHRLNGKFISSGIYYLEKWNKNESIELSINQSNIRGYPQYLLLQVFNQPSSAIYLFQKNKLDILKIPYFLLEHPAIVKNQKRLIKGKSVQYIAINHTNPCFDLPFRKALNYSINRNLIIEKIFNSSASEVNATVTNEYLEPYTNQRYYYKYDLDLARKYLGESKCYPQILLKQLELRMRADDENKAKGAVLAQYFKELGLNILVLPMEKTKLYKENGEGKGDLTLLTWYIDYDSIFNFIDPILSSDAFGNAGNRSFYSNPKVDEFIRQIRINPDLNINPTDIIYTIKEDAALVFLWSLHENYILSEKTKQFEELTDVILK